ncbi:MAG: DUF3987 domain-containing protein [Candidatus Brocadiales bacterium]|nr:DUF3987 domain-containing protein [Candidatus Brocadiales bacterium]
MIFIEEFPDYCETLTDAPRIYKEESAFDVLSSIIGRRIYLQWGEDKIFPNIYKIYIGKSTAYRKSTMLKIQKRFVENIIGFDSLLANRFSYEGLVGFIEKQSHVISYFDEFANLYEILMKNYTLSPEAFLTEIFDCPDLKREGALVSKNIILKNVFINIIGATTESWLLKNMNETSIRGGFLPRFLFVWAKKKDCTMPIPSAPDKKQRSLLLGCLKGVMELVGDGEPVPMVMSRDAKNVYVRFHDLIDRKYLNTDSLYSPFYSRALTYVLKYAMLIAIDYESSFTVSETSMEMAVIKIDRLLKGFQEFTNEEVTFNKYQATRKRVKDFISDRDEVNKTELLRGLKMPTRDLQVVLQTLLDEETLHVREVKSGNNKRTNLYSINGK